MTTVRRSEVMLYKRNAKFITGWDVLHTLEKDAAVAALPRRKRKQGAQELQAQWLEEERLAAEDARPIIDSLRLDPSGPGWRRR